MPKKDQKEPLITIQTKVTKQQYADLMIAKANSTDPRQSNHDFYRDRLLVNLSNS